MSVKVISRRLQALNTYIYIYIVYTHVLSYVYIYINYIYMCIYILYIYIDTGKPRSQATLVELVALKLGVSLVFQGFFIGKPMVFPVFWKEISFEF